jgi:arabinan endo-1,5-alpha-L-arabinosidase
MTSILSIILLFPALSSGQPSTHPSEAVSVFGSTEFVHDPSIIKEVNTWYVFATTSGPNRDGEIPVRCSNDLREWERCGHVFDNIPEWIKKESPATKELWAPDISYFEGEFHLYYAFSVFGKNTSGIALATNKTLDPHSPDFHWEDRGPVLRSVSSDNYNAIDPNLAFDDHGGAWLAFGSFWDGIKMRRIDPHTGKLLPSDKKLYSLARRRVPNILRRTHLHYQEIGRRLRHRLLFVTENISIYSYPSTCAAVGTKAPIKPLLDARGRCPYKDRNGTSMLKGGGTPVLLGNDRWFGPGGESLYQRSDGDLIVFHAYDGKTGHPYLQISTIDWTDGWPHAALEGGNPARK